MSHKSHLTAELACLGVIIGSAVVFASYHGSRIMAQHNDVVISKNARHQIFSRDSPHYMAHDAAVAARKAHHNVHEEI